MRHIILASLLSTTLLSCTPANLSPTPRPQPALELLPGAAAATTRYVIQQASSTPVAIAGVTASSSSIRDPRWWNAANARDGNPHSAWGPADGDASPTLTLDLGGPHAVSALAIKMDREPITFDVDAKTPAGWVPVAAGLAPTRYRMLDYLDLPDVTTDQLRLTFHTAGAPLLVCEVEAFADRGGPPDGPPVEPPLDPELCITMGGTAPIGRDMDGVLGVPDLTVTLLDVQSRGTTASGTIKLVRPFDGAELLVTVGSSALNGDVLTLHGTAQLGETTYQVATAVRVCDCDCTGPFTAAPVGVAISVGGVEALSFTDEGQPVCDLTGWHGACTP